MAEIRRKSRPLMGGSTRQRSLSKWRTKLRLASASRRSHVSGEAALRRLRARYARVNSERVGSRRDVVRGSRRGGELDDWAGCFGMRRQTR
jgi:hypothetical protein